MLNTDTFEPQNSIFKDNSRWLKVCLIGMFLLATLVRLDEIKAPGHLLDREFTSALFARAFYFTNNDKVEDWRRDIAITAKNQQPVLEPPLQEYLVSLIYRVVGREEMFLARYLTNAFWLIGGIFMYLITRKLLSIDEAVVATAYYLFVPMAIIVSRSFQPDSLMMMMFLISLYILLLYFERSSTKLLVLAAVLTGCTLLLRPLVIFAIFGAFLALSYNRSRDWRKLIDLPLIIFGVVSLLPSLLYYGYGIVVADFMRWKLTTSFMPYLLTKRNFWLGWFDNVLDVAEFTPLLFAMFGFFLLRNRKATYLIISLAAAYLLFSVAFTYHIHTHPYYHIQLIPFVGLCMASFAVYIARPLVRSTYQIWWVPVIAATLFAIFVSYREVRNNLYQAHPENPAVAWEIGEIIKHSPRTVYLAYYYGVPLEYYGEFGGAPWPERIEDEFYRYPGEQELSVQERIDRLGFEPEYFTITQLERYNQKHQDLKEFLEKNCTLRAGTDLYLVYESCKDSSTAGAHLQPVRQARIRHD